MPRGFQQVIPSGSIKGGLTVISGPKFQGQGSDRF